jgi:hypothetical protein
VASTPEPTPLRELTPEPGNTDPGVALPTPVPVPGFETEDRQIQKLSWRGWVRLMGGYAFIFAAIAGVIFISYTGHQSIPTPTSKPATEWEAYVSIALLVAHAAVAVAAVAFFYALLRVGERMALPLWQIENPRAAELLGEGVTQRQFVRFLRVLQANGLFKGFTSSPGKDGE